MNLRSSDEKTKTKEEEGVWEAIRLVVFSKMYWLMCDGGTGEAEERSKSEKRWAKGVSCIIRLFGPSRFPLEPSHA